MSTLSTDWPDSLWCATATPLAASPPLSSTEETDVAIVGGGYTGLSAALHLAQAGRQVHLLEQVAPGWGCSGRNGGQVNPAWKVLPEQMAVKLGQEAATRALRMANDAADLVFELCAKHAIDCDAIRPGYVQGNTGERGHLFLTQWVRQWRTLGVDVSVLSRDEITQLLGTTYYQSGMIDRRGGSVQPLSYARGLASAAKHSGAVLSDHSPVITVRKDGAGWVCETPQGKLKARTVLWCTNGYTDACWPKLKESIVPVTSFIVASEPLNNEQRQAVMPGGHAVSETTRINMYFRVDAGGRMVFGGRGNLFNVKLQGNTRALEKRAIKMFPVLDGVNWRYRWAGHPAVTTDGLPRLMQLDNNAFAGLGYNGRGVAMATMMGKQLAHVVIGGETMIPVTPLRTIPLHRLRQLGISFHLITGSARDHIDRIQLAKTG
jgi:glycine/D-amino acid oxidase-like deaminating enzyme